MGNLVFLPTTYSRWILTTNSNNQIDILSVDNMDFKCSTSNKLYQWNYINTSNNMISIDWYNLWITMDASPLNIISHDDTYNDIQDIECIINNFKSNDSVNSSISITMNKPPKGGYCYYENYQLICKGWNDIEHDYPLFYSFVLNDNIHLSGIQTSNRLSNVYLPSYANSITAYIYDSNMAKTKYKFDINPITINHNLDKHLNANNWIMAFLLDIDKSNVDDFALDYWFNQTLQINDNYNWNLFMNDGSPIRYLEVISTLITLSKSYVFFFFYQQNEPLFEYDNFLQQMS